MIVLRFKFACRPERIQQALAVLTPLVETARRVEGVIRLDVGRAVSDPDAFVAIEVLEDEAARERLESLPEFATFLRLLPELAAEPPEVTQFEVASATPALG